MTITAAPGRPATMPATGTVRVRIAPDGSDMTAFLALDGANRTHYMWVAQQLGTLQSIKDARVQGMGARRGVVITFKAVADEGELHGLAHTLSSALGTQLTVSTGH